MSIDDYCASNSQDSRSENTPAREGYKSLCYGRLRRSLRLSAPRKRVDRTLVGVLMLSSSNGGNGRQYCDRYRLPFNKVVCGLVFYRYRLGDMAIFTVEFHSGNVLRLYAYPLCVCA